MGVPQITTVTPSEGLASGRGRVVIRGSQFRVQESSAESGALEPTVSVTFNGVDAEYVLPIAHYRLDVVTPRFLDDPEDLPAAVDVVVTNLDDNGDPIGGETVTKVDGFTFRHPDLVQTASDGTPTAFSTLQAINETFIQVLRRDLLLEVVPSTDPDWSDDPASGLTAVASLPAVTLDGPMVEVSLKYRSSEQVLTNTGDLDESVTMSVAPFTGKLSWGIVIISDRKHDAVHAMNAAADLFHRRPVFDVPVKAGSSDTYPAELAVEEWSTDDRPQTQVYTYRSRVSIEPVYFADDYGYAADGVPNEEVTVHATEDSDEFLDLGVEPNA
jgi:hypothetical protein